MISSDSEQVQLASNDITIGQNQQQSLELNTSRTQEFDNLLNFTPEDYLQSIGKCIPDYIYIYLTYLLQFMPLIVNYSYIKGQFLEDGTEIYAKAILFMYLIPISFVLISFQSLNIVQSHAEGLQKGPLSKEYRKKVLILVLVLQKTWLYNLFDITEIYDIETAQFISSVYPYTYALLINEFLKSCFYQNKKYLFPLYASLISPLIHLIVGDAIVTIISEKLSSFAYGITITLLLQVIALLVMIKIENINIKPLNIFSANTFSGITQFGIRFLSLVAGQLFSSAFLLISGVILYKNELEDNTYIHGAIILFLIPFELAHISYGYSLTYSITINLLTSQFKSLSKYISIYLLFGLCLVGYIILGVNIGGQLLYVDIFTAQISKGKLYKLLIYYFAAQLGEVYYRVFLSILKVFGMSISVSGIPFIVFLLQIALVQYYSSAETFAAGNVWLVYLVSQYFGLVLASVCFFLTSFEARYLALKSTINSEELLIFKKLLRLRIAQSKLQQQDSPL